MGLKPHLSHLEHLAARLKSCPFAHLHQVGVFQQPERRRALKARVSSAIRLALAGVGEGTEDCAGVLVHHLTKVHGDGEQDDQEEEVHAED